jgi:acyl-CoA dehydrogenase
MRRLIFEPEHEAFRDSVRRFFQSEFAPDAAQWRAQGYVDRSAYLKAGAQGYLLMWAPEEYGGAGIDDFRYEQVVYEENVRYGEPGFYVNLHSGLVAPYIGKLGSPEQRRRWLPACVRGEKILAIAMTEPDAGSDLRGIRTTAVESDGHWVLNGSKTYISNGQIADVVIVVARSVPGSTHGLGLFVVEEGMAGFRRGKVLKKIGLKAQDTSELYFDNVQVPAQNVLGDPTQAFAYLRQFLVGERLIAAIGSVAAAQYAFDVTLDFVKERRAFGRPIGTFQNSRFVLAQLRAEIDAIQTYVDQCVLEYNADRLSVEDAAAAKLLASELEGRVADQCLQLHGGAGYMEEYAIARLYADARVSRIFAGSSEIMREIIGRGLGLDERKLR